MHFLKIKNISLFVPGVWQDDGKSTSSSECGSCDFEKSRSQAYFKTHL